MKKFLALVMALVMTMSLVTISAGAAYTDASETTYKEAVDVVSAVGIVGGYTDGSFNPTGSLTRGAAAKIICNMLLGPTTAEALVANEAPYADVAVNNTFAGYIAYLSNEGIISGYADGTFRPAAPLTGYAFWKMLLGALGYDASVEGYTGTNWAISVAKRGLDIGLNAGLKSDFVGTKTLTREEACLYAFNTLKAFPVKYTDKGTNITIGDIVINTGASEAYVPQGQVEYYKELFGANLVAGAANTVDTFGRPATAWTYKGKAVGTYAKTADYTYYGSVKAGTLYKDMGKVEVEKVETRNNLLASTSTDWEDITASHPIVKDGAAQFGLGNCVIEFFVSDVDADSKKEVKTICIQYGVDTIKTVNAAKYDKDGEIKTKANVVLKTSGKTFETTAFAKDQYVLYAVVNGAVKDLKLADSIEGKVDVVKGTKVTINGTTYTNNAGVTLGAEGTFYLGVDGTIVAAKAKAAAAAEFAYIYSAKKNTGTLNADGIAQSNTVTVYAVLEDGSKVSYEATDALAKHLLGNDLSGTLDITVDGVVVPYKMTDGKMDLNTTTKGVAQMDTNSIGKGVATNGTYYFSDKTDYVFVSIDATKKTVTTNVVTGYKNIANQTAKVARIYDNTTKLFETVFVLAAAAEDTTAKTYAVLLDGTASQTKDATNTYNTYAVAIDGVETTLTWKNADKAADLVAGEVFEYTLKGGYINTAAEKALTSGTVTDLIADYVVIDGAVKYLDKDVEIYLATVESGVYTLTETTLAKNDGVKFYTVGGTGTNANDIAFALVTRAE